MVGYRVRERIPDRPGLFLPQGVPVVGRFGC
jgi:hypothetical protein